jgi:methylase of polypeptide subunit release factors
MEMCSGPGFMGYYLATKLGLSEAYFLDINPEVKNSYATNRKRVNFTVKYSTSNCFKSYTGPKVDLIVLNPPHLVKEEEFQECAEAVPSWFPIDTPERERQSRLILLDEDFKFHEEFCSKVYDKLTSNGQIAFLENEKFIPHIRLQEHLGENFDYEFIQYPDTRIEGYYLLIATKK